MTTWTRKAVAGVMPGEGGQALRLRLFRAAHPDVVFLLRYTCPRAWAGEDRVCAGTLRELLDELEGRFTPDG